MSTLMRRNSGLEAPCVEESFGPDRTTMILPLTKIGLNEANPEANSPLRVRIVEELRANPKATQIGLATKLGVSRATVQRAMNALAKEDRIKRQGGTRGRWVVNKWPPFYDRPAIACSHTIQEHVH